LITVTGLKRRKFHLVIVAKH